MKIIDLILVLSILISSMIRTGVDVSYLINTNFADFCCKKVRHQGMAKMDSVDSSCSIMVGVVASCTASRYILTELGLILPLSFSLFQRASARMSVL